MSFQSYFLYFSLILFLCRQKSDKSFENGVQPINCGSKRKETFIFFIYLSCWSKGSLEINLLQERLIDTFGTRSWDKWLAQICQLLFTINEWKEGTRLATLKRISLA
jgi:hypothetical protein